jgi:uncharacterized protein (TIGR02265 family)
MELKPRPPTSPGVKVLPRVPVSVMEGLFVRGLKVEGAMAERLASLGYDLRKPEVTYPISVYQRCISAARYELYSNMADEDAYRALGRKLADGFLETLVGKVVGVAMPMIGPARVVERIPRYVSIMGRPDMVVRITPAGDRGRRVHFGDTYNHPDFMAGNLEVALERASAVPTVVVEERTAEGYRLFARW